MKKIRLLIIANFTILICITALLFSCSLDPNNDGGDSSTSEPEPEPIEESLPPLANRIVPIEYEVSGYIVQDYDTGKSVRVYSQFIDGKRSWGWKRRIYFYQDDGYGYAPEGVGRRCVYSYDELERLYSANPGVYPEKAVSDDWFDFTGDSEHGTVNTREWAFYYPNPANRNGLMYHVTMGDGGNIHDEKFILKLTNNNKGKFQEITMQAQEVGEEKPTIYTLKLHTTHPVTIRYKKADGEREKLINAGDNFTKELFGTSSWSTGYRFFIEFDAVYEKPVTICFTDSKGGGLSGKVSYYDNGNWYPLGFTDESGSLEAKLLSKKYTFKIEYEGGVHTKEQDLAQNNLVEFQTISCMVKMTNSDGTVFRFSEKTPVSYTGSDGLVYNFDSAPLAAKAVYKELLPCEYTFHLDFPYDPAPQDIVQDISKTPAVDFQLNIQLSGTFDIETLLPYLMALQEYGIEYSAQSGGDPLFLTMQYIRRQGSYNEGKFPLVAGEVDINFVNMVSTTDPVLPHLFDGNSFPMNDTFTSRTIDFNHLMVVIAAELYNTPITLDWDNIKVELIGEHYIDQLSGWAGDLQTVISDLRSDPGYQNNYPALYQIAVHYIGNPHGEGKMSIEDTLADIDAKNIACKITDSGNRNLCTVLSEYYGSENSKRYTAFLDNIEIAGLTKEGALKHYVDIFTKEFIIYIPTVEKLIWPLYKGANAYPTENELKAIRVAFWHFMDAKLRAEGSPGLGDI